MKTLSIIVPIYNSEKYLKKCIDSILKIERKDIEIILINDGSTDNSLNIIKNYIDERIIVINKINEGQGVARNIGVEMARGKYISFIDSDDYIDGVAYEKLLRKIEETDVEFIMGEIIEYNEITKEKKERSKEGTIEAEKIYEGEDLLKVLVQKRKFSIEVWQGIYKKDFLIKNNIKFKPYFYEDHIFSHIVFNCSPKVMYCNIPFYYYVRHEGTTTTTKSLKQISSVKELIFDLIEYNEKNNLKNKENQFLIISNYYNYIFFLKQKRLKEIENKIKWSRLSLREKIKYFLIRVK